ncbi:glucose-induced degradation protein 8 homolog [Hydra vulgaris]|uniref:Glucose-induced degradation protein 8 homolog n=1 Tax=Hydra vulgaris TaxID=6087 RepID=A0ABM4CJ20_HYDVU
MYSFLHRINAAMANNEADKNNSLKSNQKNPVFDTLDRVQINRIIMNYLTMEGFKEAAEKFRIESGVEPDHSLEQLDYRIYIRDAVQNGKIDEAIDLTNALNPEILDNQPSLYFHLQQQKLIELIRDKNLEEALVFSQNVLAELCMEKEEFLDDLEKTMTLLAYEDTGKCPYGELLSFSQRQKVASELNAVILDTNHQETLPKIAGILKLLLWSQNELDKKKVKYPQMTDIVNCTLKNIDDEKNPATTLAL